MSNDLKLMCAAVAMSLVLGGCGSDTAASKGEAQGAKGGAKPAAAGKRITVGLLPKQKGVPYFTSCEEGAVEAAKELGNVDLVYDGPTKESPEAQASLIDQWRLKHSDVIAVSPSDPNGVGPAMKKAIAAGVKVITWDADAGKDAREFLVNQATPKDIGYALVDAMAKDMGGAQVTGEVAIITASLTAANQNAWIKYIKERLPKYPGLHLVAIKPSGEDGRAAFAVAQDFVHAYPNLKGIFAISSVAFPNAADAVQQAGKSGKVLVTGLDQPNEMKPFVKAGTVKSVILWNTKNLGYLTVYVARALADGTLKLGDKTFKAGRLGTLKVEGDNVLLGGIMVFNKDNIDNYNF